MTYSDFILFGGRQGLNQEPCASNMCSTTEHNLQPIVFFYFGSSFIVVVIETIMNKSISFLARPAATSK